MGKSWFRKRGGRLSRLSPQRGTGPCVARLTSPGSGTERPAASGPGALGAPAGPGAGHARGVGLGPTRRAWDTVGRKRTPREPRGATPGATRPGPCRVDVPAVRLRGAWQEERGLREGHGVWGSHGDPCVRRWGTRPSGQTGPGRQRPAAGQTPPRLRASPAPRPGPVPGSRPCAGPRQRFLSDSVQLFPPVHRPFQGERSVQSGQGADSSLKEC